MVVSSIDTILLILLESVNCFPSLLIGLCLGWEFFRTHFNQSANPPSNSTLDCWTHIESMFLSNKLINFVCARFLQYVISIRKPHEIMNFTQRNKQITQKNYNIFSSITNNEQKLKHSEMWFYVFTAFNPQSSL